MRFLSTLQVSRLLGISISRIQRACWLERIDPLPQKTPAGNFLWTVEDINRASWVLCRQAFEPPPDLLARSGVDATNNNKSPGVDDG